VNCPYAVGLFSVTKGKMRENGTQTGGEYIRALYFCEPVLDVVRFFKNIMHSINKFVY
jgi:hypothetical protein